MGVRVEVENGRYKVFSRITGFLIGTLKKVDDKHDFYELDDRFDHPIDPLVMSTKIDLQVGVANPTTTGNAPDKVKLYIEKMVEEGKLRH